MHRMLNHIIDALMCMSLQLHILPTILHAPPSEANMFYWPGQERPLQR